MNHNFEYFDETKQLLCDGILVASVGSIIRPETSKHYENVPEEYMEEARKKGSAVHEAIESFLKIGKYEIAEKYDCYVQQFIKWFEKTKPEILSIEKVLFTKRFWGIADLIVKIKDKIYIIDLKTTSKFYSETTALQTTGYKLASDEMFLKIDGLRGLHLQKDKYEVNMLEFKEERFLELVDEYEEKLQNSY
jgi:hypothetical protein